MKLYKMTFMDLETGRVVRFERNMRQRAKLISAWKKKHPLRKLLLEEEVRVPSTKDAFLNWLNEQVSEGRANEQR